MSTTRNKTSAYRHKWRRTSNQVCHCCRQQALYCRTCRHCGCAICQECMQELKWGLCTPVFWHCPDCGELNGL